MSNKKKKIPQMQCVITTPEIQEIHRICCMQKQLKGRKWIFMTIADMHGPWTKDHCHILMHRRAWCKSYINAVRHGKNQEGYRIFLSGPGGTGKSHAVHLTQRDMSHFFQTHSEIWWWSTYCPCNCPNSISSIPNWWIYNPFCISIIW